MSKQLRKQKKKRKTSAPASRFNDALAKYQRIQRQNARFRDELDALVERVTPQIANVEKERINATIALSYTLIPFISKKSLPEYLRDELHDWIQENIAHIAANPFATENELDEIYEHLNANMDALQRANAEKFLHKLRKQGHSEEEIEEAGKVMDAMNNAESFEEFMAACENIFGEDEREATDAEEASEEPMEESFFTDDMFGFDDDLFANDTNEYQDQDDIDDWQHATDTAWDQHQRQLNQLLKKSSITKLFRRIAKAIHPDLEPDPKLKEHKHQQMSQLIIARDEKDIALILQIYKEVIGELPDEFSSTDYESLTKLLNYKIEELRDQKNAILHENPRYQAYYEWFYAKNQQQEKRNIASYKKEVELNVTNYLLLSVEITSIKTLRPFLEERRQMHLMNRFDRDFGDIPF